VTAPTTSAGNDREGCEVSGTALAAGAIPTGG